MSCFGRHRETLNEHARHTFELQPACSTMHQNINLQASMQHVLHPFIEKTMWTREISPINHGASHTTILTPHATCDIKCKVAAITFYAELRRKEDGLGHKILALQTPEAECKRQLLPQGLLPYLPPSQRAGPGGSCDFTCSL